MTLGGFFWKSTRRGERPERPCAEKPESSQGLVHERTVTGVTRPCWKSLLPLKSLQPLTEIKEILEAATISVPLHCECCFSWFSSLECRCYSFIQKDDKIANKGISFELHFMLSLWKTTFFTVKVRFSLYYRNCCAFVCYEHLQA